MSIDREFLGAAIRKLRLQRGLTQSALAAAAGLVPNSVAVIERGERAVSVDSLNSLAAALEIPPGCLAILGSNRIAESPQSASFLESLKKLISVTLKAEAAGQPVDSTGRKRSTSTSGKRGSTTKRSPSRRKKPNRKLAPVSAK